MMWLWVAAKSVWLTYDLGPVLAIGLVGEAPCGSCALGLSLGAQLRPDTLRLLASLG